jgi:2-keto-3-deoxy-L-rhamnonate aldolase RhmA
MASGGLSLGTFVMEFATRGLPWLAQRAGLDFLIYDNEHGNLSHPEVRAGVLGCRAVGITPVVRTRTGDRAEISPALDAGALAVIVPMTESPEQIAATIEAARYHPDGSRGAAFGIAHDLYDNTVPPEEAMAAANAAVMVIPQIETARGLEAGDEICSVPGVDLIWMGHGDLSQSLGIPGQFEHPLMVEAVERIAAVAGDHDLPAGRLVADPGEGRQSSGQGYRALAMATDIWLLRDALAGFAGELRGEQESTAG